MWHKLTTDEERVLRDLLRGHQAVYPVIVFGMLGGDPNDLTTEEFVQIVGWLHALGYERRVQGRFGHPRLMSIWVREATWPGETFEDRKPYRGIPLRPDPEFRAERREALARKRAFFRRLAALK
jgi:hypothetical protein